MILALASLSAFAVEQVAAPVEQTTPEAKPAKAKKALVTKAMKAEAKAACLQENAEMAKDKKALRACIHGKLAEKK